jgi:hypothetical protein
MFPHISWDLARSYPHTVGSRVQCLDTHIGNVLQYFGFDTAGIMRGKSYWLQLVDSLLSASSPFGFVSVEFEFNWIQNYIGHNLLPVCLDWLTTLLTDYRYTFWTYEKVADWFKGSFSVSPSYSVNFRSPLGGLCEWYWSTAKRVCRVNGLVVSYFDFSRFDSDKFKTQGGFFDWLSPPSVANSLDISLYGSRVFDDLTMGDGRDVSFGGSLSDFVGKSDLSVSS